MFLMQLADSCNWHTPIPHACRITGVYCVCIDKQNALFGEREVQKNYDLLMTRRSTGTVSVKTS
jgi:hypothetical protein